MIDVMFSAAGRVLGLKQETKPQRITMRVPQVLSVFGLVYVLAGHGHQDVRLGCALACLGCRVFSGFCF